MSAPFHSSLLKPAADVLATALAAVNVSAPQIPVINNVDVASPVEPGAIRDALVRVRRGILCVGWKRCAL